MWFSNCGIMSKSHKSISCCIYIVFYEVTDMVAEIIKALAQRIVFLRDYTLFIIPQLYGQILTTQKLYLVSFFEIPKCAKLH